VGAFVECVQSIGSSSLSKIHPGDVVVLGYPDDRGVSRNGGRSGACEAPDLVRSFLYKMTPDPLKPLGEKNPKIWDFGNLHSWGMPLKESHEVAQKTIRELRGTGARILSLGGGHDWAFPDFSEFKGRILNVDAHLDMRPLSQDHEDSCHSGTPFRRLAMISGDASHIGFLGLQRHCNARSHVEFAKSVHASLLFFEELPQGIDQQWTFIHDRLRLAEKKGPIGLSVDMDAFPQSRSPGVSAPQAFGIDPRVVCRLMKEVSSRIEHLGIYELNPRYDHDYNSCRLAARFAWDFIFRP
jgi:formiminoglutamase